MKFYDREAELEVLQSIFSYLPMKSPIRSYVSGSASSVLIRH